MFQSSFELTGYITGNARRKIAESEAVSKLFRAYGLYNHCINVFDTDGNEMVSKLFRAYGLYNI